MSAVKSSSKEFLFLIFLPLEWRLYSRRPRWLAMAALHPVLAIEPPAGILMFWLHPGRLYHIIINRARIRKGEGGILFFRPLSLVTFGAGYRIPWLASIDRILIKYQLRRAIRKLDLRFKNMISFVFKIHQHYVTDLVPAAKRCYEVTDEYLVYPSEAKIDLSAKRTRKALSIENKILGAVDIVFASSEELRKSRSKRFTNTHYVANSADYRHFASARRLNLNIPGDLKSIASPRIGFVGNINELTDIDLVKQLARERPDISIVLIGRENGARNFVKSTPYRELKLLQNIYFLGFRDYELLPAYLKGLDVCIMPFRINEWMKNSFPNKIFQYLAAGKPIVSTDFPAIRHLGNAAYIARNNSEFIALIGHAIMEDNELLIKKRMETARLNSTEIRATQTVEILRTSLAD